MTTPAQSLWHTTPLFYAPYLLQTGAICSATELVRRGLPVRPRPSAIRRKTQLGLADYVHLSPYTITPLLRDKFEKGYPHVLLSFERGAVLDLPGVALLRYNTKRWAHRDDFAPVTDADEQAEIWTAHTQGKYPSLEILVPGSLALAGRCAIVTASEDEANLLREIIAALGLASPPIGVSPLLFPIGHTVPDPAPVRRYFAECRSAGRVLDPPALPFD